MSDPKLPRPPRWADRFLEWYCRPELLEEIQGDAYELFDKRLAQQGLGSARRSFAWDVLRSFRRSTIRKITIQFTPDMYKSNFKIAWRNMTKQKMYSAIKIGGLAVGIAACLLIALFIRDELSYDLHYPQGERIYRVVNEMTMGNITRKGVDFPAPLAKALREDFPEIEEVARINPNSLFTGGGNPIRPIEATQNTYEEGFTFADQELIDILQIPMVYGDPAQALAEPNSIVISKSKADKYYPGQNPVGKLLIANNNTDRPDKIGGVMADLPTNSHLQYDFLIGMKDLEFYPGEQTNWNASNYHTYVRLRPGTDLAKLEKKLMPQLLHKYFATQMSPAELKQVERSGRIFLQPIRDIHLYSSDIDDDMRHGDIRLVWLFGAIAGFILLIAGINFVNLSTARSANRAKEVGLRKTVGSSQGYLITQFLVESGLFSVLSFVIGLGLACLLLPYFNQISGKTLSMPWLAWWFLPSLLLSSVGVGILAGIYPAFYLSSFQAIQVLKGKISTGSKSSPLRSALVVFQFTASIVLIVSTMVVTRQMNFILHKKLGFEKEQVLLLQGSNTLGEKIPNFKQQLQNLPQVASVAVSDYLPVNDMKRNSNEVWNPKKEKEVQATYAQMWQVDYDYIRTLGMKIVAGRDFSKDMRSDSQSVVINQTLAKELHLTQPLGGQITNGGQTFTVIGVVEDFHFESMREDITGLCLTLGNSPSIIAIKLRTQDLAQSVKAISALWQDVAPNQPIRYTFLDDSFAQMYSDVQRIGQIVRSFALLAILVACLGLFALSTYLAEQRSKEIGIRKVLGASVQGILLMLVRSFLQLVLIAVVIATPLAWFLMREWLQDFAYRYPLHWDVFALAGLVVALIAVLTIGVQALRSALRNPLEALRGE
jgi:putative ABC transport system permease protein